MRVQCDSLNDFIENLEAETDGSVYNSVVYVNEIKSPIDKDRLHAVRFLVVFRISAVVDVGDGQYLLAAEDECGVDYHDASQEKKGTEIAKVKFERLKKYCEKKNLKIRPGVVDF